MREKLEKSVRWTKGMMKEAAQNHQQKKQPVYIRLDEDVVTWFKAQGQRYQTKINAVLKAYIRSQK